MSWMRLMTKKMMILISISTINLILLLHHHCSNNRLVLYFMMYQRTDFDFELKSQREDRFLLTMIGKIYFLIRHSYLFFVNVMI